MGERQDLDAPPVSAPPLSFRPPSRDRLPNAHDQTAIRLLERAHARFKPWQRFGRRTRGPVSEESAKPTRSTSTSTSSVSPTAMISPVLTLHHSSQMAATYMSKTAQKKTKRAEDVQVCPASLNCPWRDVKADLTSSTPRLLSSPQQSAQYSSFQTHHHQQSSMVCPPSAGSLARDPSRTSCGRTRPGRGGCPHPGLVTMLICMLLTYNSSAGRSTLQDRLCRIDPRRREGGLRRGRLRARGWRRQGRQHPRRLQALGRGALILESIPAPLLIGCLSQG